MEIVKHVTQSLKRLQYHEKINDDAKLHYDIKTFFETAQEYHPRSHEAQEWYFQLQNVAKELTDSYPDRLHPSTPERLSEILKQITNVYLYIQYSKMGKIGTRINTVNPKDTEKIKQMKADAERQLAQQGKRVIMSSVGKSQLTNSPCLLIQYIDADDVK